MSQETQLEVSLSEGTQEEVALVVLPKCCFLTHFLCAKVIPDRNGFRLEDSTS